MFGAVQFVKCFDFNISVCPIINTVKVTELPPVWERYANFVHLSL